LAKDRVHLDIGPKEPLLDWSDIDWRKVKKRVRNLRQRIFRATQNSQWKKAHSLMKLMLRSYANLLVSVRKITQENHGKRTPGIDKQIVLTPKARAKLVQQMMDAKSWNVKPATRLYIPKTNGKQRPLGILTIKNRIAQAIVKNALEPSWEAQFEPHSYGFRPGRSTHDAIEQCFRRLKGNMKDRWVLDADIKSAFDSICQQFILQKLGNIPAKGLIKRWLQAGYVEAEMFHDTIYGVQQGGVISPVLANVALDGMQKLLPANLGFIRYADDFVITAQNKKQLEAIKPTIEIWLAERGLVLNDEKTRIVSIHNGFDFLGFNIKHYQNKCLIKPQRSKVLNLLQEIRLWLKKHRTITAEAAIRNLNPLLNGWAQYYRCGVSSATFNYVHTQVWKALWSWCKRRHPKKGSSWIKGKYFRVINGKAWTFHAIDTTKYASQEIIYLTDLSRLRIERHRKVKGSASPDDPSLSSYWQARSERVHKRLAKPNALDYTVRKMLRARAG
jgi:RNA-directed DNA polymerase